MLVSRHSEAEQNHWTFPKPSSGPRMSTNYDHPLSTQPDWPGQYSSFLPPGDNIFGQSYDHVSSSSNSATAPAQSRAPATEGPALQEVQIKPEASNTMTSPLSHRRSIDILGLRHKQPSPIPEQAEPQGDVYAHKAAESAQEESLMSSETPGLALNSNPINSSEGQVQGQGQGQDSSQTGNGDEQVVPKDEDDDGLDDDDMLDGDGDGGGDGSQPQTAAERTAQRRKMKRFRLTHQQTRFLMSEFAKQPHPDAAHRERLSREIPGLSPRQVQVWFQNRRAKIKRLTADDRDRMIKMRAVPDDFDNVQALHSPYGAVHGLGTPLSSPVDFTGSSYAEHMMRPLMVDVRRPDSDDHLSPTGLTPGFGSIGFNPSASLSTPDILSPLSPSTSDRYGSYSHLNSPLGPGPRTSNPFVRQNSLDTGMQMHHSQRQQVRPLQPLHLRETMSRSRSDNLQSPLRSSMSWKGDSIDYTTYHHGGTPSPQLAGRQQSLYQSDSINSTSTTLGGYESSTYSGSTVQSPTHLSYPGFSSSLQPGGPSRNNRLRAASATLPLGLDLRTQFRAGQGLQPSSHSPVGGATSSGGPGGIGSAPRSASASHHLSVSSSYTASFPSAPLTAPIDFNLPRTPGFRSSGHDYSMPQMSAPIAPPNDFSQAFQASMASGSSASRTPLRDSFGAGSGAGGGSGTSSGGPLGASVDRSDDYSHSHEQHPLGGGAGLKRKHSFHLPPGGGASSNSGPSYGSSN